MANGEVIHLRALRDLDLRQGPHRKLRLCCCHFVPTSRTVIPAVVIRSAWPLGNRASALLALTKPRLAVMSVLTAMTAFVTARPVGETAIATLIGTSLAAGGALSLNQWWERRTDALMERTRDRPLPRSQLSSADALRWSLALSLGGVGLLAARVNLIAAFVAAATILIYGVVYTPLKRRTHWATEVGAVSGALPALLGSAAAGDIGSRPGLALAGIILFWQMPHFFAIGWRRRADYRTAGFPLRPALDPTGVTTAKWSAGYTMMLVVVSLVPCALGWLGAVYGVISAMAGVCFLRFAWLFVRMDDRDTAARSLFFASIIYLPTIMAALLIDRFLVM
jgi:protoheme IX farnesyltransferase